MKGSELPTIDVIQLDYDNTYDEPKAEKGDGLITPDDAAVSISQRVVFAMAPPIVLDALADLATMKTPPIHLGDDRNAILVYRGSFLPVEHPHVYRATTVKERTQREAQAHAQVARHNAMKETTADMDKANRTMSQTFRIGMIGGVVLTGIIILGYVLSRYA